MKNLSLKALAAVCLLALASSAHAQFASEDVLQEIEAEVTIGGTPEVDFSVTLVGADNPVPENSQAVLGWTANAGDNWKISDTVALIQSTMNKVNAGIQIYTNNKDNTKTNWYEDPTSNDKTNEDSNAGGLILYEEGGGATNRKSLPLAWSIKDSSRTINANGDDLDVGLLSANPNNSDPLDPDFEEHAFQWLFMKDKGTDTDIIDPQDPNKTRILSSKYVPGEDFITILQQGRGIHFGQRSRENDPPNNIEDFGGNASTDPTDPKARYKYVYFEGLFAGTVPDEVYGTHTLTFEAFVE